jgi:protoheme IX farnesyltransferase
VAASTLAGFYLHPGADGSLLPSAAGVFLLAAGSSALNQIQEQKTDALMDRTRNRPVAAGRLHPAAALAIAIALLASGLAALAQTDSLTATVLGAFSALWYNAVYTPLKKRTAFALLPGALCGALPPLVGWTAAGGHPTDPLIVLLAGLFFLWQIPHFWRRSLRWRDDYRRAGLPVASDLFSDRQNRRILSSWIISLGAGALAILLLALPALPARLFAAGALFILCACAGREICRAPFSPARLAFQADLFMALFTLALLTDRIA